MEVINDRFERMKAEDESSSMMHNDNPPNFQLDLDYEAMRKNWEIRFGRVAANQFVRPRMPDDEARELIPLKFRWPVHGEPGFIHSGVKTWGENIFYWTGLSFIGGMGAGALSGSVKAYRQTSSLDLPAKLKWNSMMNWAGRHGRIGSNGAAAVLVLVHGFAILSEYLRRKTDPFNWVPALSVCGAIAASRRYTIKGKVFDGGLVGLVAGLFAGSFLGLLTAGAVQYQHEAPVLPQLQAFLGTHYFERSDTRYLREAPRSRYDDSDEIVEENLID